MKTFLASVAAIALMGGVALAEGTQSADPAESDAAASGTAAGTSGASSAGTATGIATGSTAGATAGGGSEVAITTTESEEYGKYLTDAEGRAVYILEVEDQAAADASACEGECAEVWPPVLAEDAQPQAQGEADAGMLSMTERPDGTSQVTYDGKPLYYYEKDEGQAAPTGQDVHDEWGEWYLLQPTGETVEEQ